MRSIYPGLGATGFGPNPPQTRGSAAPTNSCAHTHPPSVPTLPCPTGTGAPCCASCARGGPCTGTLEGAPPYQGMAACPQPGQMLSGARGLGPNPPNTKKAYGYAGPTGLGPACQHGGCYRRGIAACAQPQQLLPGMGRAIVLGPPNRSGGIASYHPGGTNQLPHGTHRGATVGAPPAGIDPASDAAQSLGDLTNYLGLLATGTNPTPDQTAVAQQAIQSLAQDVQQIETSLNTCKAQLQGGTPPPSTSSSSCATKAAMIAAGGAAVGALAVWLLKK